VTALQHLPLSGKIKGYLLHELPFSPMRPAKTDSLDSR
jgi:hypothetical protein